MAYPECDCMVCRMGALIQRAGEIEADSVVPNADFYLMFQAVTFMAQLKGVGADEFEVILNQAWAQSELILHHRAEPDKRKMN